MRFADDTLKNTLEGYIEHINIRNENVRVLGIYNKAKSTMQCARTEYGFKDAASLFESIAEECHTLAEAKKKDEILFSAKIRMVGEAAFPYEDAIAHLVEISGWKDADDCIAVCRQKLENLKAKDEERRVAEAERQRRQQLNLCQHCGGEFRGFFSKKCVACGKPKDY